MLSAPSKNVKVTVSRSSVSPIHEPGSKSSGAFCTPSPSDGLTSGSQSQSMFHSATSPEELPIVTVAALSALPSTNSQAVPELSIPPFSPYKSTISPFGLINAISSSPLLSAGPPSPIS